MLTLLFRCVFGTRYGAKNQPMALLRYWRPLAACLALGVASPRSGWATPEIRLPEWRTEATSLRQLGENNAPQAYDHAKRLLNDIPASATIADRALVLNQLTRAELYLGRTNEAASHAQQALALAKQAFDPIRQVEAYLNMAIVAINQADVDTIAKAPSLALQALQGLDQPDLLTEALLRQAMSFRRFGKIEESIAICVRTQDIAQNTKSALAKAYAGQCMAISYEQSGRTREALDQYIHMRTRAVEAGSRLLEAEALFSMSMAEFSIGNANAAEAHLAKAAFLCRTVGAPFAEASILNGRAEMMRRQNRLDETVRLLDEVLRIYRQGSNRIGMWWALVGRGSAYQSMGRLEDALNDGEQARALAQGINLPLYLVKSAERLSAVHAARKDYQKAYDYAREAADIDDKTAKDKSAVDVIRLTEGYQNEIKQREIDRLTRLNERRLAQLRWFLTIGVAATLLFLITVAFLFQFRRSQRRHVALNRELDRSRNELQATLSAIPDLLFKFDLDGRCLDIHSSDEKLLLLPASDLLGRTVQEILPPKAANQCMEAIYEAHACGKSTGIQYGLDLPDGEHWFELSVARKPAQAGTNPTFIAIAREITERKQYQDELLLRARLQEQVGALAQAVPGFIFTIRVDTDGHTHFPFASSGVEDLFGLRPEDIRTNAAVLRARYYPDDLPRILKRMEETERTLAPFRIEIRIMHPEKGLRWVEIRSTPQRQPDGATEWHGLMIDVTERKRTEEQLAAREREFRTLVENLPDLVSRYDRDCRRIFVNSAVGRIFDKPVEELVGKTPEEYQIYPPLVSQQLMQTIRRTFDSGTPQQCDIEYAGRDFAMLMVPESNKGTEVKTVLAISRDVTAIRSMERRMARFMTNVPAFVFTLRRSPNGRFSFPFSSPGIEMLLGINPGDVRNDMEPLHSQVCPADAVTIEKAVEESSKFMTPLHQEFRVCKQGQPDRWIECRAIPERDADGAVLWQGVMLDITTRKLAEDALVSKEKVLAEAQRIAHVGSWELDLATDELSWSDETFRILEIDPERFGASYDAFLATVHPDDRTAVNHAYTQPPIQRAPYEIEHRLLMPDGRVKYVHERCETHYDSERRAMRLVGTVQDVTARKKAEFEARTLNLAVDSASDAVFLIDAQLRFVYVNDVACRSLGYRPDELLGMSPPDIDPDVTRETCLDMVQSMVASGKAMVAESRHRAHDGSIFPVEISSAIINIDSETFILSMVRDISERKRMEAALAAREREFRALTENSPDAIVRYDSDGCIRYINPHLAMMTGISQEDALGQTVAGLMPSASEDTRQVYLEAFSSVLRTGIDHEIELTKDDPDKATAYYHVRFVAEHDEQGYISGILAIGRDITEIKHKEHEIKESRDMLRQLSAYRDSAREEERKHVAREIHDHLGQLLTAQRLDIATLKYEFASTNPTLEARCQHLMDVTDMTIQAVRDTATRLRPSSLDMGIVPALGWLANDFRKRSGIVCDVIADSQNLELDELHSLAIFRIVQESLTNVTRHSEAKRVDIILEHGADGLLLSIRDNGKGFDPAKVSPGSFGLLGIRERALMIGGGVRVISTPGQGTEIEVHIPPRGAESQD